MTTIDEPTADDPTFTSLPDGVDPQLLCLFELTRHDVSFGVTLFLPWGVATGHTISGPQFAESLGEAMQDGAPAELAAILQTVSEKVGELAEVEADLQQTLHLKNVTCSVGGRLIERSRLRIRMADISAWDFGRTSDEGLGFPDLSFIAQR